MADNQYLIEQVRSKQYAHPTVPNTNGAIAVPGTRPSVSLPHKMRPFAGHAYLLMSPMLT